MDNLRRCQIENTVTALQTAIRNKMQAQREQNQFGNSPVLSNVFTEILKKTSGSYAPINDALEHGGEFVQGFIKRTNQNLQREPWETLRKVAVYSFATGLFFGLRRRRASIVREKK